MVGSWEKLKVELTGKRAIVTDTGISASFKTVGGIREEYIGLILERDAQGAQTQHVLNAWRKRAVVTSGHRIRHLGV